MNSTSDNPPSYQQQSRDLIDGLKAVCAGLKENDELTQLRDWLLPMLMNGQVRVA